MSDLTSDAAERARLTGTSPSAFTGASAASRVGDLSFRDLADVAPVMLWVSAPDGRCTFLSEGWREYTGQSPTDGLDRGWLKAVHPDDQSSVARIVRVARRRRELARFEFRLRRADGTYGWVFASARPWFSPHGELLGFIGSLLDITDRRRAEDALRQREADARRLHLLSAELVVQHDMQALHVRITEAAAAIMRSQHASMQMRHADAGSAGRLRLLASLGFDEAAVAAWSWVDADDASTCAIALRHGRREIVSDVETCHYMAGTNDLRVYRALGIRAVQTTPLTSRDGNILGMLSTHWDHPHTPPEHDLRNLDILARQAADLIERGLAADALRETHDVLSLVMRSGRVGAWSTDLGLDGVWWSPELQEIFGLQPGEFAGTRDGFLSYVHPDDVERVRTAVREAIDHLSDYLVEFRFRHRSGEWRWMEGRGQAVPGYDGMARLYGIGIDITEQKEAEATLRFLASVGAALTDPRDLESTLERLVRLSIPFLADWSLIDLVNARGELERVAAAHVDPAREGLMREYRARFAVPSDSRMVVAQVLRSGESRLIANVTDAYVRRVVGDAERARAIRELDAGSTMCLPLAARGTVFGVITFVRMRASARYDQADMALAQEVARRVASAIDSARLYHELDAANRRKDEFLAILAHELRNPLAPIRTGLEVLRLESETPGIVDRIGPVIERQVDHIVRLVDDLLDISRVTSGQIQLQRQPSVLADLVERAVEANRSAIDLAGLQLRVNLPDVPVLLDVDPTRFVQVVSNLLHNASKFTTRGGQITLTARVDSQGAVPQLELSVADTGIGIDSATLPRVFDLFVRGDDRTGGLGVGLALARQLVELHDGTIEASSEGPGKGSRFTIRMPVALFPPPTPSDRRQGPRPIAHRVLIIDDNVDAADMLAAFVSTLGGEAATAHDGEEGLRRAAEFRPEVILLDIGMPKMDGYETCRRLRAEPYGRQAFIIALTGWGQEQDRQRALAGGFDAHLTKPADPRVLGTILSTLPPPLPDAVGGN